MVEVKEEWQTECCDCKKPVTRTRIAYDGAEIFTEAQIRCNDCMDLALAREEEERREMRGVGWSNICPPLYRATDPKQLLVEPGVIEEVLSWKLQPKGVGLVGESGKGKTRLAFLLLHKLYRADRRVLAITAKRFENCCHRMFDKEPEARDIIKKCKWVDVLFIDDIGKEKYTERVESEFYDLIEERTSHLKPILWTANFTGGQLAKMMSEDRGAPIVRRLREFCTIYSL